MLKTRVFVFALIFVSIAGSVSASGISINPNPVSLGQPANISINMNHYRCYLYFYHGKDLVTSIILGNGDTCSGDLSFSYPFPESLFPEGKYTAYIFSLDSSSYVSIPFSVVSSATTPPQNTPAACTPSSYPQKKLCEGYSCGEVSNGTCGNISCGSCSEGKVCNYNTHLCEVSFSSENNIMIPPYGPNEKNNSLYDSRMVFLLSDSNWKDVLPFVSAAVWDDTSGNVQKYPFLVWHNESTGFDADSAIYFMQQYSPDKVDIIGDTPSNLDALLVAAPPVGASIPINDVKRYSTQSYIDFWKSFDSVVYVQDNYPLALLASTYASLLGVPLVIEGSSLDSSEVFSGRNVICVGDVSPAGTSCSESYTKNPLQDRYKALTGTKNVIFVNANDFSSYSSQVFYPEKSPSINQLYTKTSLLAPVLASARHELLLSIDSSWSVNSSNKYFDFGRSDEIDIANKFYSSNYIFTYQAIGNYLHQQLSGMGSLTIMASPYAVPIFKPSTNLFVAGQSNVSGSSLDPNYYADLDGDGAPDVDVGRIAGISTSDVSSYVARDLFIDSFQKTNNAKFFGSSFDAFVTLAKDLASTFSNSGYGASAKTSPQADYSFNPDDWKNQDLIFYADHGGSSWAGISSNQLPVMNNSFIDALACNTISTYYGSSFWAQAIRKGSTGFIGAVSHTGALFGTISNSLNVEFLNLVYYYGYNIGGAFREAYSPGLDILQQPYTLIGDPLLYLHPTHRLNQEFSGTSVAVEPLCQSAGGFCIGSLINCCGGTKCSWFTCQ